MTTHKSPAGAEKKLNLKQREAALLLAQGTTIKATSEKVGCNESTIDGWKHKPEFMEAISAAEDEFYNDSLKLLKRTTKAAVMTLVSCLDPKVSDYVRVSSASKLLDASMEVHSIKQLEARIQELEALARGEHGEQ